MLLKFEVETNNEKDVNDAIGILLFFAEQFARSDDKYIVLNPEKTAHDPIDGLNIDSEGLPWNARIHSSSKAKNKDGSWKRMRGLDDATYNSVVIELRDTMSIKDSEYSEPCSEPEQPNINPSEVFKQKVEYPISNITYLELVSILGQATKENRIDNARIQEAVTGVGLAAFTQLAVRIDLIPAFITRLGLKL